MKKGIGTRMRERHENIVEPIAPTPDWYLERLRAHETPLQYVDTKKIKEAFLHYSNEVCEGFKVDDDNRRLINLMIYYFSHNEKFLEFDFVNEPSLKKGLLIIGSYGFGKSILFETFRRMYVPKKAFRSASTNEISLRYQKEGADILENYIKNNWYYDDFGTEEKVSHYEQSKYIMKTVMEERYKQFQTFGWVTHASSNMMPDEIEEKYGERIGSRIKEMFNIVVVNGKDRRK